MVRSFVFVFTVACSSSSSPTLIDSGPIPDSLDAAPETCSSPPGSANITVETAAGTATFTRLYAGGIWLIGPVAPVSNEPMVAQLQLTTLDVIQREKLNCCRLDSSTCCELDGVGIEINPLPGGSELGGHVATISSFPGAAAPVSLSGTVTITEFVHPFENEPGRIVGSVTASNGATMVDGTFDNSFCVGLLGTPL
ncbi:MAG: hypothetical protein AB7R00_04045 [Kofleriaceae bacterium]